MNTTSDSSAFLLLFRGESWHTRVSPEEGQRIMADWMVWFERHQQAGKIVAAQPLGHSGRVITASKTSISDGPFVESKEAVAGYFILNVADEEEAVAIAKECPSLVQGVSAEVRPILECCPSFEAIRASMEHTLATA